VNARTLTRFGWCALLAASAGGCGTLDRARPAPSTQKGPSEPAARARQPDYEPGEPRPLAPLPGTVVGASGQLPAIPVPQPMPQPQFPPTGLPLNQPRPLPMPMPTPGAPGGFGTGFGGSGFADPTLRPVPTVSGARWDLGPNEQPLDRLVELTKYLDAALAQNRELLGRVRELETLGKTREQALNEAVREIDSLSGLAKERAALLIQLEELRARVKQIEDEDIKLFGELLRLLNDKFPPEKKP
jgi:hypothetical protein